MITVLDPSVLVAALRSPQGDSRRILHSLYQNRLTVAASVALFLEYESVLTRPEHLQGAGLTRQEMDVFLNGLAALVRPVQVTYLWRPQLQDPDDEMVLEAAVNGAAESMVTFNINHFKAARTHFGTEIFKPGDFIGRSHHVLFP